MKNYFLFLFAGMMVVFSSCGKQTNTDSETDTDTKAQRAEDPQVVAEKARQYQSLYADYSCDLLYDSIVDELLVPEEYYDTNQEPFFSYCVHCEGQYAQPKTTNPTALWYADVYNALIMSHNMYSDWETARRFEEEEIMADSVAMLDCSIIRNDTIRQLIQNINAELAKTMRDEDRYEYYEEQMNEFYAYLHERNDDLLEQSMEPYNDIIARKAWFDDFDSIQSLRGKSDTLHRQNILTHLYLAKSPEERHVYILEYAHSDEMNAFFMPGAALLDREFVSKAEYSPLVLEMWQTWRAMCCSLCGHSTWSYIPNGLFNRQRAHIATYCLEYIAKHPNDVMAQSIIVSLGGVDNVARFGYAFGNGGIIEEMSMFPEVDLY